MTTFKPKPKAAPDWIESRVGALARQPGKHTHPRIEGFGIRTSPKLHSVWTFRFRGPDGKETPATCGTLGKVAPVSDGRGALCMADALAKFEAIKDAAFNTTPPPSPREGLTLLPAFERWLQEHRKDSGHLLAAATVEYYQISVNRYLKEAHGWVLADTTTDDWMQLLSKARERSKTKTRGLFHLLKSIYDHFIELGLLPDKNPIDKRVLRVRFSGSADKVVANTRVAHMDLPAFYSAVEGLRNTTSRDAILALLLLGWRRSAVLEMEWADINLEEGGYYVRADKPGWKRYEGAMALGHYAVRLLRERKERMAAKPGGLGQWVFPARHGDKAAKPCLGGVRGSLETVEQHIGYRVRPQDLRRTFITIADLALNGKLRMVGRLVGHRQLKRKDEDDDEGTDQTAAYAGRAHSHERRAASVAEEVLLEIAGALPLSAETQALLREAGLDPSQLTLTEVPDDDDDDTDEGGEEPLPACKPASRGTAASQD